MTRSDRQQQLLGVLDSHGSQLHRLLVRLTLNEAAADDLMQELFVQLSQSASFDGAKNPVAYVRRTATNLAFEWRRRRERQAEVGVLTEEPVLVGRSSEELVEQQDEMAQVLDALNELSEDYRQVLVLHRLECESYEAIAVQMEKTPHQVRAICSKAMQRLRDILNDVPDSATEVDK